MAPAMNSNMFAHPAVVRNLETLTARGVRFVEPGEGYLACGWIGKGRLAEPADVVAAVNALLRPVGALAGKRVLVTAGPTFEDIDPVRFIGNRSSGKMGYALAAEAARRGAQVTLITGPTHIAQPRVSEVVAVRSAADMHSAVMSRAQEHDLVLMAAAVADFTPAARVDQKIKKTDGGLALSLAKTSDILADLGRLPSRSAADRPLLVGFAAETQDVVAHAREKLQRKAVDMIVANDVSQPGIGFEVDANAVTLVARDGIEEVPPQSKAAVAGRILDRVERLLNDVPVRTL
jgi:phosphopantothenoylcysteine decarboxylase/phosphopantothenate--cysteine ligase